MAENSYPVMTTRRIGKEITNKKLGKKASRHLAELASEYVRKLVCDADKHAEDHDRSTILESDFDFVISNFKGY